MDLADEVCYRCWKSTGKLLHCAMCYLHAHPDCFLINFPGSDLKVGRNWICDFCKLMEEDALRSTDLNATNRTFSITFEGNVPEDYFSHSGIVCPEFKLQTDRAKYFYDVGDTNYGIVGDLHLADIFPLDYEEKIAEEWSEFVLTNRGEMGKNGLHVHETTFNYEKDISDSEYEIVIDEDNPVTDAFESSESFYVEWPEEGKNCIRSFENVACNDEWIESDVKPPIKIKLPIKIKSDHSVPKNKHETSQRLLPKSETPTEINGNDNSDSMDVDEADRITFYEEHLHCYQINDF